MEASVRTSASDGRERRAGSSRSTVVKVFLAAVSVAVPGCGSVDGTAAEAAAVAAAAAEAEAAAAAEAAAPDYGIVIHGGAGTIRRETMSAQREAEYRAALEAALRVGYEVLEGGGSALDAVEAAVVLMEDSPLFNAGKGSVFTSAGTNELDAAIMDGRTGNAGAVAGITRVRNPIRLARLVMTESPHVFLVGDGAETFGRGHGVAEVEPDYFFTEQRWEALRRALERRGEPVPRRPGAREEPGGPDGPNGPGARGVPGERDGQEARGEQPYLGTLGTLGTVGAVALDRAGNLAAATSTGGMTAKRFGRVGDVPVIGAGTYAHNESCGISGTGHGEFFIRNVVAHDICARVLHGGAGLEEAAREVVMERLVEQEGDGGVIGMDPRGNVTLVFNTPGMYRGHMLAGQEPVTGIFRDE